MSRSFSLGDIRRPDNWISTAAEFIGTTIFVFIGVGSVVGSGIFIGETGAITGGQLLVIALGHGLAITTMVAATARISGGHLNPAVTIAMFFSGNIDGFKGLMYVIAQLLGAICGALLIKTIVPDALEGALGSHAIAPGVSIGSAILLEMCLTFGLVFVIYATAVDERGPSNLAPFAIGMVVVITAFVGAALTGASLNPARTLGPAVAVGQWADHWVYWVAPITGGTCAAILYKYVFLKN